MCFYGLKDVFLVFLVKCKCLHNFFINFIDTNGFFIFEIDFNKPILVKQLEMKSEINIKSIANALSISISTVSRALQNNPKIGLKTREKVLEKAKELSYVPNPASLFLQGKKMFVIGIIVPALDEEFFTKVINTVEDFFEKQGYQVFVFQTRNDMGRQDNALELMLKYRVDGLLVSLAGNTTDYSKFKKVEDFGIPVVFFDRVPRSYKSHKIKCDIQ